MDLSRVNIPLTLTLTESKQNAFGDPVRVVTDGPRLVWAELKKQTVKEFINNDAMVSTRSITFAVRYQDGLSITTKHTVNFNDATYDVIDIEHDYSGRDYTLLKVVKRAR